MKVIAIACLAVAALRLAIVATDETKWESTTYEEIAMCRTAKVESFINTSMIIQNESFETNDQRFIRRATEAGLAEVVLGKLAVEQATSDKVKEFARMMVSDHTSASDELRMMAKGKNVPLPDVCSTCNDKIRDLQRFRGREFDRRYMQLMVSEVQEAIATFSDESRAGGDADLRAWATKRLTSLQQNLSAAEGL